MSNQNNDQPMQGVITTPRAMGPGQVPDLMTSSPPQAIGPASPMQTSFAVRQTTQTVQNLIAPLPMPSYNPFLPAGGNTGADSIPLP